MFDLFTRRSKGSTLLSKVERTREKLARLSDEQLKQQGRRAVSLAEVVAATAVVSARVLGLAMFDVQVRAAVALAEGHVVEMATGEGKTLAAVPAIAWYARAGEGVHVLTANDYLAGRDAEWMRVVYDWMGLSVASIHRTMTADERKAAYRADVTYATATEVGFDYLRDGLALHTTELVHRPFASAVIDEVDSILIDEARIPLVIAGGASDSVALAAGADRLVRTFTEGIDFTIEQNGRSVQLAPEGAAKVEAAFHCGNLYDTDQQALLSAIHDALHAHRLLARDVDYLVSDDAVWSVDELKGRIVADRRWPAELQTALEFKERVRLKQQGRILGSISIESLVALYPRVCGMTGTAATQASEFREMYGLEVIRIPTRLPVARIDQPDEVFPTRHAKDAAIVDEIASVHATGRPVLVGTATVEESEQLSRRLGFVPHHVLNARNEAAEAGIISRAGECGAVTISTNMAGRGVDIRLGAEVAALGGLHVIGTNRHDSRRIDDQLRGRAGRQGDPGSSRFFVSQEDRLIASAAEGGERLTADQAQRRAEGRSLDIRIFLRKYESILEAQRRSVRERREAVLTGGSPIASESERLVTLATIDDLWSDYLEAVRELRAGTIWTSLGGRNPLTVFLAEVHGMFAEFERTIPREVATRLASGAADSLAALGRGATWTYLTTDEPFGSMTERLLKGRIGLGLLLTTNM
jgi:preprotein translocase subunit SecA